MTVPVGLRAEERSSRSSIRRCPGRTLTRRAGSGRPCRRESSRRPTPGLRPSGGGRAAPGLRTPELGPAGKGSGRRASRSRTASRSAVPAVSSSPLGSQATARWAWSTSTRHSQSSAARSSSSDRTGWVPGRRANQVRPTLRGVSPSAVSPGRHPSNTRPLSRKGVARHLQGRCPMVWVRSLVTHGATGGVGVSVRRARRRAASRRARGIRCRSGGSARSRLGARRAAAARASRGSRGSRSARRRWRR